MKLSRLRRLWHRITFRRKWRYEYRVGGWSSFFMYSTARNGALEHGTGRIEYCPDKRGDGFTDPRDCPIIETMREGRP